MEPGTAQLDATQQHQEYIKLGSGKGQGVLLMTRSTFLLGGQLGRAEVIQQVRFKPHHFCQSDHNAVGQPFLGTGLQS